MIKKTLFGVIGLIGFMAIMFAPSAHAATSIPAVDQSTRALLGQTLNVLQSVLNTIESRVHGVGSPIQNPAAVSSVLGGIKQVLISIDAQLSGLPITSPSPIGDQAAALPSGSLEGSGASVVSAGKETANAASALSPKLLFVLLPILILLVVAVSFVRRRDEASPKDIAIAQEAKNEVLTA